MYLTSATLRPTPLRPPPFQVVFRVGLALLGSAQEQLVSLPFEALVAALNGRKFAILDKHPDVLMQVGAELVHVCLYRVGVPLSKYRKSTNVVCIAVWFQQQRAKRGSSTVGLYAWCALAFGCALAISITRNWQNCIWHVWHPCC